MTISFTNKLKSFINTLDEPKVEQLQPDTQLFNIHKRSLPVETDKIVVFNVTKKEADRWLSNKFKAKIVTNAHTVIYYDVIPVDANANRKSVFYNDSKIVSE